MNSIFAKSASASGAEIASGSGFNPPYFVAAEQVNNKMYAAVLSVFKKMDQFMEKQRQNREKKKAISDLNGLDDIMLRDIGVERHNIREKVENSWRDKASMSRW